MAMMKQVASMLVAMFVAKSAWAEGSSLTRDAEAVASSESTTTVSVESKGDPVTVAEVEGHLLATGYSGRGTIVVSGMAWKDICISPCSFELKPGLHELLFYGDGVTHATEKVQFKPGVSRFEVEPGSRALAFGGQILAGIGAGSMLMGGGLLLVDSLVEGSSLGAWGLPFLLGGAAGTAGGIVMIVAGQTEVEQVAGGRANVSGRRVGVTYRGTF